MSKNFEFIFRNPGHWDIYIKPGVGSYRAAVIRGEPGMVSLYGYENPFNKDTIIFPSVESCMAYVCATLIKE